MSHKVIVEILVQVKVNELLLLSTLVKRCYGLFLSSTIKMWKSHGLENVLVFYFQSHLFFYFVITPF